MEHEFLRYRVHVTGRKLIRREFWHSSGGGLCDGCGTGSGILGLFIGSFRSSILGLKWCLLLLLMCDSVKIEKWYFASPNQKIAKNMNSLIIDNNTNREQNSKNQNYLRLSSVENHRNGDLHITTVGLSVFGKSYVNNCNFGIHNLPSLT